MLLDLNIPRWHATPISCEEGTKYESDVGSRRALSVSPPLRQLPKNLACTHPLTLRSVTKLTTLREAKNQPWERLPSGRHEDVTGRKFHEIQAVCAQRYYLDGISKVARSRLLSTCTILKERRNAVYN